MLELNALCEGTVKGAIGHVAVAFGNVLAYHALHVLLDAEVFGVVNALAANAQVELAELAQVNHMTAFQPFGYHALQGGDYRYHVGTAHSAVGLHARGYF